jgi:DNA-binding NtrC family response regulator
MNTLLASDLLNGLLLDFESRESPSMPELDKVLAESEGLHHYRSQNYPRAIESFRQELKACRKPETALLLRLYLANSLLKTGANEEAHSHFFHIWSQRHTFSRDPLNLQFNMALCARRMGNRELAIRHLETVIAGAPDENRPLLSAAWRELARIHEGSDNQQANHCRRKSLEILGPDEGGLVQQIEAISLAFSTDDNEGCLKLLAGIDRAGLSPSQKRRCEIYELLVLARAGEHKRLISRFKQLESALKDDEHAVDLYATAAISCRALDKHGQAERWLEKAWQLYSQTGRIGNRELLAGMDEHLRTGSLEQLDFQQLMEFGIIGVSEAVLQMKNHLRRIRKSTLPVLITGETGTGKELAARSFVEPGAPFVAVNCRAIPPNLMGSHLFGHVRGAFTGANADSGGLVKEADGGVLFLDEVGDLPLDIQPLLFRFLDDGSYYRVGEHVERRATVRIIAATNLDTLDQNQMRIELTNRLAGFRVEIPPLRERADDLVYLAAWFVHRFNMESGSTRTLGPNPGAVLASYSYPGNIRELRFLIQRACTISSSDFILPAFEEELRLARARSQPEKSRDGIRLHVEQLATATSGMGERMADVSRFDEGFCITDERRAFEEGLRRKALDLCKGNIRAAARLLGESPTGIQRMLAREKGQES